MLRVDKKNPSLQTNNYVYFTDSNYQTIKAQ